MKTSDTNINTILLVLLLVVVFFYVYHQANKPQVTPQPVTVVRTPGLGWGWPGRGMWGRGWRGDRWRGHHGGHHRRRL